MKAYPLLFGVRDAIAGKGFVAGVQTSGKALMELEDGEWWVTSVTPAGVIASGSSPHEAYANFRQALTTVLFDSAALTDSFEAFERDVQTLAGQTNEAVAERWEAARAEIRAGAVPEDEFASGLPRKTNEVRCGVLVVRFDVPEPERKVQPDNKLDLVALPAA